MLSRDDAERNRREGLLDAHLQHGRDERARPRAGARQRNGHKNEQAPEARAAHGVRLFERALLHARDKAVEPLALRAQPGKNLADEEHDERHRHEVAEDGHRDGDAVIQAVRHADRDRAAQLEHRHHGDEEGQDDLSKQAVPNLQITNPPKSCVNGGSGRSCPRRPEAACG